LRIAISILAFSLCASAQTPQLQKRPEPPAIHPVPCEEHLNNEQTILFEASSITTDKAYRKQLLAAADKLNDKKMVRALCTNPTSLNNFDLMMSFVVLQMSTSLSNADPVSNYK
jgi:hypothetical protein